MISRPSTIPDSVHTIDDAAFSGKAFPSYGGEYARNNKITSLTLGNSIRSIGEFAFAFNELTSLTIPDSVQTIYDGAFATNRIDYVVLSDAVTTLDTRAFSRYDSDNNPDTVDLFTDHHTVIFF